MPRGQYERKKKRKYTRRKGPKVLPNGNLLYTEHNQVPKPGVIKGIDYKEQASHLEERLFKTEEQLEKQFNKLKAIRAILEIN